MKTLEIPKTKSRIKKILIANRGEIAVRIIRTCRELDIETVAIYTEGEENFPHAIMSSESYCLGEFTNLQDTYLNGKKIIQIAKNTNADAIHPGYGFLSENADFANLVTRSGIIFIGPTSESMRLMGDKIGSKNKMNELGVPVIPGYHGENQDYEYLEKIAEKIGLPLLIKASAGGGGRGMRIVRELKDFREALNLAQSEAQNSFGDARVLIEKYIEKPRHIEVQVFSSTHGEHLHFFERECSIQRRHQKIIEECPSTILNELQRKKICETAVNITKNIGYVGAGTIEFIWDDFATCGNDGGGEFYFLEMNTRLQVEHPVTEMVVGHDLVALQIKIAQGEHFGFNQNDITMRGHAIETRIYAEDPMNDFMPAIGKLSHEPYTQIPFTRIDSGIKIHNEMGINFDPMVAKMIAWGENREHARRKLLELLKEAPFLGFKNNRDYIISILKHPKFINGETYTHFIEDYKEELRPENFCDLSDEEKAKIFAAITLYQNEKNQTGTMAEKKIISNFEIIKGFRNV